MKRILCLSVILLLASIGLGQAQGLPSVQPPDMVGVWKPIGVTAAVRIGENVDGWPTTDKPLFNLKPRPYVVVQVQSGREIAGYEIFANHKHEPFVGAFTLAGKLLVNTMKGTASVDVYGNEIEWCWQTKMTVEAVVSCDVMGKVSKTP